MEGRVSTPRYRHSRHTASDAEYREYSAVEALTSHQHYLYLASRRQFLNSQVVRPLYSLQVLTIPSKSSMSEKTDTEPAEMVEMETAEMEDTKCRVTQCSKVSNSGRRGG